MCSCGWCGHEIKGVPISSYTVVSLSWSNSEVTEDIWNDFSVNFCCYGCAWAFGVEIHRLYGMRDGKELRSHLIEVTCPPKTGPVIMLEKQTQ